MFFRKLNAKDEATFRQWAKDNWAPGKECSSVYHPVVREEWARLDQQHCTVGDSSDDEPASEDMAWEDRNS